MKNQIKLYDFPVKGTSVETEILSFEKSEDKNFFTIKRIKDKYSIEFNTRSIIYTGVWNELPIHNKNDILDQLPPIAKVTVNWNHYDRRIENSYLDVFVVDYQNITRGLTKDTQEFARIEWIIFRSRKIADTKMSWEMEK